MGEPLPYVLGWWEFYGRRFRITPEVLIPRPETELIIEVACEFLSKHPQRRSVLDVGTGSGCVGVTLCAEFDNLNVISTDLSWESLQVAQLNACDHKVFHRIALVQSDLLSGIAGDFDLVCANLPYISTEVLSTLDVAEWEPRSALDGGREGISVIRRMLSVLPRFVRKGGKALFEIGADQGDLVSSAANAACPESRIEVLLDHAGYDRLLVISFES
jgi:release factor glutamine methyltransferase